MDQIIAGAEEESAEKKEPSGTDSRKSRVASLVAALLPLVQSIPPLAVWGGLMTIPFISYIVLLFVSGPSQFFEALFLLFFGGFVWEQITAALGLGILVYSLVHMRLAKKEGLITSGPYRLVRHPQYLGVVLFTLTLTTRSYWIGTNTWGMSWIDPKLTIVIWFGTLFAYIVLALVEELHLSKAFASEYDQYRQRTGFLFPFVRFRSRGLEIILSILIPALILFTIIFIPGPMSMPPLVQWPGTESATIPPI